MVEYESTLHLCASLILIVLIGFLYGISNHYKKGYVVIINNIVFIIVLPCHIFTALRKQDWLDSGKEWEFIASFLVLRIFMLVIAVIITLIRKQSIFECVSTFLGTSWISTIILGLPLCSSIFGPTYIFYGIYAALSSFFFQLPFMIAMFEIQNTVETYKSDKTKQISDNDFHSSFVADYLQEENPSPQPLELEPKVNYHPTNTKDIDLAESQTPKMAGVTVVNANIAETDNFEEKDVSDSNLLYRIIKLVLWAWFKNPISWAIVWGFLFALIWSGSDMDQSPNDSDWPTFIDMAMNASTGMGAMTSPLGVLVIGLFAADQWIGFWRSDNRNFYKSMRKLFSDEIPELLLYLFLKFFVCPAIMCCIVLMFGFDDKLSRIGVIIAVIPTSLASFILAKKYELKTQNVHALNVIIGTILMFPFVIMWLKIMDSSGLFPEWE